MRFSENSDGMRIARPSRRISLRTRGRTNGQLTRLVAPSDVGRSATPFVLLDRFALGTNAALQLPAHPHSGIAVLTYLLDGSLCTVDSSGRQHAVAAGAVDWLQHGRGAWEVGSTITDGAMSGYRLWVALPPVLELGEPHQRTITQDKLPVRGAARVLLGEHDGAQSPLRAPTDMTCLHVNLKADDHWRFDPPVNHDILWIAVHSGSLDVGEPLEAGEFVMFDQSNLAVDFLAEDNCDFLLGSAERSPFEVVEGQFSVHTNAATLRFGEIEIGRIATQLRSEGKVDAKQAGEVLQRLGFGTASS